MKLFLKGLFGLIFLFMVVMTVRTSLETPLWRASFAANSWPWATLYDAYFGFLTFFCWVAWRERSLGVKAMWSILHYGAGEYRDVAVPADPVGFSAARRTGGSTLPAEGFMTNGFLTRKLFRPLLELLRQGVTPEKLSLSIALGAVLGTLPAIGWNTALCALAALIWRLNVVAIQLVNYFVYPLQIALLIPFFRLGEKLFRAPHLPISVSQIHEMMRTNLWGAIQLLWSTTWHALVVWALIAPFLAALIYVLLLPALRRVLKKTHLQMAKVEVPSTG